MSDVGSHDEFLALCALATANQLTEQEQKRLQEHLAGCRTCREALRQYETIVDHAIPDFAEREGTGNVEPGPAWSPHRAEEALFKRIADGDGSRTARNKPAVHVQRSHGTEPPFVFSSEATWRSIWLLYAAAILLSIVLAMSAYHFGIRRGVSVANIASPQPAVQKQSALEEQKRRIINMQNRATLTGYLGKDAVLSTTCNQTAFAVLSLATHRFWKDRNSGKRQSATTWHRCVVFGKLANYASTLTKGAFIQLEGEIRVREYFPRVIADSASSAKKSITEIRVFRIMNLDRPGKPGQSGGPPVYGGAVFFARR